MTRIEKYLVDGPNFVAVLCVLLAGGCQTDPLVRYPSERGRSLALKGQYPEAIRQLERELTFRPSPDGYYLLGYSYARLAEQRGDPLLYRRAEQAFRACLERNPEHAGAYYELTSLLVRQGRTSEAEDMLRQWASRNPGSSEARVQLARFYHLTGQRRVAEDLLIEALTLDPKNPRTLVALEMVRRNSDQVLLAERNATPAKRYDPTEPELAPRSTQGTFPGNSSGLPQGWTAVASPALDSNPSPPARR
jgi:tetratricopeptide (TPR) repeat protein